MSKKTLVLGTDAANKKINRIAYQIYEHNFDEDEIVIIGIAPQGVEFSKRLIAQLKSISSSKISFAKLVINKDKPLSEAIELDLKKEELTGKSVVLIDDVLNSGKTLIHAANELLKGHPKKLSTAILVDRMHRMYPIKADFVGLTLSTTLQEHIRVEFNQEEIEAYLV